jgi:hypothetical protein
MKTSKLFFALLLVFFFVLCPVAVTTAEPQQPANLNVTYPPGWDLIGTDGEGSRWFLYQGLKETISKQVFRVQLNLLPAEDNQAYKDAGAKSMEYLVNVDCSAGTVLFVELTGHKVDGTNERYVFPSSEQAAKPAADSALYNLPSMVCQ